MVVACIIKKLVFFKGACALKIRNRLSHKAFIITLENNEYSLCDNTIAFYEVEVNRCIVQSISKLDNLKSLVTWLSQNFGLPKSDIQICIGTLNDKNDSSKASQTLNK